VYRLDELGKREKIADGYEVNLEMSDTDDQGQICTWNEQHLIVRSEQFVQATAEALQTRLSKAEAELSYLLEKKQGKTRIEDAASLSSTAGAILKHYRVAGLMNVTIEEQVQDRSVRAYGDHPAQIESESVLQLSLVLNQPAIEAALRADQRRLTSWFCAVKVREMRAEEVERIYPQFRSFINANTPQEVHDTELMDDQGLDLISPGFYVT